MADFEDELSNYIQARTASDQKERVESAAANAAADALFGTAFPFPHPEGFQPSQDAPAFALHPVTHLWHDATTGTFSYYDAASETYIPVEGPASGYPGHQSTHYPNPHESYVAEFPGVSEQAHVHLEAPPESDATLRLCVLSSTVLKVGGVIMMDASGLSFGRDRPLSGQGKRVRMVEMEISRFHASIYLDRKQAVQENAQAPEAARPICTISVKENATFSNIHGDTPPDSDPSSKIIERKGPANPPDVVVSTQNSSVHVEFNSSTGKNENDLDSVHAVHDDEKEEGEYPDSPGAGAQDASLTEQTGKNHNMGDEEEQEGEIVTEEQRHYREYQKQMLEYQQYYQDMSPPVYVDTFQITDCGSTHGTFLNGERLSAPKTASQPFALKHLDKLQLGSTIFEIHAHEEGRICATCQVSDGNEVEVLDDKDREGLAAGPKNGDTPGKGSPLWTGDSKLAMERERIEEMSRLRKKWTNTTDKKGPHAKRVAQWDTSSSEAFESEQSREYVDRAAKRRLFNPDRSSPIPSAAPEYPPHEEVSGFHVPVAKSSKGHAMLSKMGWKTGTGLGATSQGVIEPVQLMVSDKRAGLGSGALQSQGTAAMAAARPAETPSEAARRKARERYAQLR